MTTWSAYFQSQRKEELVRQVTFLCGTEPVLVDEVVRHVTALLGPSPWNHTAFVAGQDSEREIWAEMERHPIDRSTRLIVIRDAEKIRDHDRLIDWIGNRASNPKTFAILISNDERIPVVPPAKRGDKTTPMPFIQAFTRRGHVVECRPFTQATAKHAVAWVQSKVKMPVNVAGHLLNRANGDLRLVRDTCFKLNVLGEEASIPIIDAMLSQRPRVDFEDALLSMRKKEALFALTTLSEDDYSMIIGRMDAQLDLAGMVYDMTNQHQTIAEIMRFAGRQAHLVPKVQPFAKHYDPKRRTAMRQLLAVADDALRGGQRVGVMEALVQQW